MKKLVIGLLALGAAAAYASPTDNISPSTQGEVSLKYRNYDTLIEVNQPVGKALLYEMINGDKALNCSLKLKSLSIGCKHFVENAGYNNRKLETLTFDYWDQIKYVQELANKYIPYAGITTSIQNLSKSPPGESEIESEIKLLKKTLAETNFLKIREKKRLEYMITSLTSDLNDLRVSWRNGFEKITFSKMMGYKRHQVSWSQVWTQWNMWEVKQFDISLHTESGKEVLTISFKWKLDMKQVWDDVLESM